MDAEIQRFFDDLAGSTTFWVVVGLVGFIGFIALFRGGR